VVTGDFNGDGFWNCADIDDLVMQIVEGTNNPAFDMNGDGLVDLRDITDEGTGWLAVGGLNNPEQTGGNPFREGDADLSGAVDVSDFNTWNANKFTAVSRWCAGDFDATGVIDVSDFNIWNGGKFTSSMSGASVPEPAGGWLLLLAGSCWMLARRK
jgi:hypothetical protein